MLFAALAGIMLLTMWMWLARVFRRGVAGT